MWQGEDFPLDLCWIKFGGEREKEGRKNKKRKKEKKRKKKRRGVRSSTFLRIHENRTVGFRQSKRKSSSTRRELHVGTRIWGFAKLREVGVFSPTFVIFGIRAI